MAFSYGFFNSHGGDRTYSAKQFGSIFDGIINDGVFRTIGNKFSVSAGDGMKVKVGSGRGWFCHTWVLNTNDYTVSVPQSEVLLNRVDALVLEIDHRDEFRRTRLTVLKGPAENLEPTWPPASNVKNLFNFWDTDDQKQIPIAYIRVLGKVTQINTVDLFSVVGKASYGGPAFVTGPLETVDLSEIYSQIQAQWNGFYSSANQQLSQIQALYDSVHTQYNNFVNELNTLISKANQQINQVINSLNQRVDQLITSTSQRIEQFFKNSNDRMEQFYTLSTTRFENFMGTSQDRFDDFLEFADHMFRHYMREHNDGFNDFVELKNSEFEDRMGAWELSFSSFWSEFKNGMEEYLQAQEDIWTNWFQRIQGQLSEDAATNLQRQIDALCFVYIMGERAVLGIAASTSYKRVIFGTYGSISENRVMLSAPSRDTVWMFDEKAILSVIASVILNRAVFSKYAGVTGERVVIENPTWYPYVPVEP